MGRIEQLISGSTRTALVVLYNVQYGSNNLQYWLHVHVQMFYVVRKYESTFESTFESTTLYFRKYFRKYFRTFVQHKTFVRVRVVNTVSCYFRTVHCTVQLTLYVYFRK